MRPIALGVFLFCYLLVYLALGSSRAVRPWVRLIFVLVQAWTAFYLWNHGP